MFGSKSWGKLVFVMYKIKISHFLWALGTCYIQVLIVFHKNRTNMWIQNYWYAKKPNYVCFLGLFARNLKLKLMSLFAYKNLSKFASNCQVAWALVWVTYRDCWIWKCVLCHSWLQIYADVNINLKLLRFFGHNFI